MRRLVAYARTYPYLLPVVVGWYGTVAVTGAALTIWGNHWWIWAPLIVESVTLIAAAYLSWRIRQLQRAAEGWDRLGAELLAQASEADPGHTPGNSYGQIP